MAECAPALLVDVDGVLNPKRRVHRGYRRHRVTPNCFTYTLWLDAAHGPLLRRLATDTGAELVWASYWCDDANGWIAPRVGLPRLPYVPIEPRPLDSELSLGAWKARHVASWAGERPFVWFEDEPDVTECLLAEEGIGEHLLVPVDPLVGLTEDHLAAARTWLTALDARY
ncbi:MAG: HAD domain-containing protein [Actinomadura sp.]